MTGINLDDFIKKNSAKSYLRYPYLKLPDDFVIIDTETTGTKENDEVVELSVVSSQGQILYHSYYYPEMEVNPFAAQVNHLSKEKLSRYPKFSETEVERIISAINGRPVVGHNIPFDVRVILQTMKRYNIHNDALTSMLKKTYDTLLIAKKHMQAASYSLNNLTTMVGITREETHNSTEDCIMTLEFINRLEDVLKIKNEYSFICPQENMPLIQKNDSVNEIERD